VLPALDDLGHPPKGSLSESPGIGIVGSGWIVRECHLPAYTHAGCRIAGITSRTAAHARALASEYRIGVHDDWRSLVDDAGVEIVDIAYPPDAQPTLIRQIVEREAGVRGILAQKPLAPSYSEAAEVVSACAEHGVCLAVNQNMRYDHSIRALKRLLDAGALGEPVMAQITMHARVGWMPYAANYDRKAMLIMSIHHLDAFRFLFGEPDAITAVVRSAPGSLPDLDEMAVYTLTYPSGLLATAIDNCFSPVDQGIEWRVDGTAGTATGTIGWPDHPWGSPSSLRFIDYERPDVIVAPRWTQRWFPDAFAATMAELLNAVTTASRLGISGEDNLGTMALLEAAYRSAGSGRSVSPRDVAALR
jgi:predicted dehydrogenase